MPVMIRVGRYHVTANTLHSLNNLIMSSSQTDISQPVNTGDKIVLAPMEGVIDAPMRRLLTGIGGYTRCVTEFVRVTNVLLPEKVFLRYCKYLFACHSYLVAVCTSKKAAKSTLLQEKYQ